MVLVEQSHSEKPRDVQYQSTELELEPELVHGLFCIQLRRPIRVRRHVLDMAG